MRKRFRASVIRATVTNGADENNDVENVRVDGNINNETTEEKKKFIVVTRLCLFR